MEELKELPALDNPNLEDEFTREKEDQQETEQTEEEMIREEEECRTKDPIRKFHFNYDQSVAMMNMHPEATEKDTNQKEQPNLVSLAPGEGSKPVNMILVRIIIIWCSMLLICAICITFISMLSFTIGV